MEPSMNVLANSTFQALGLVACLVIQVACTVAGFFLVQQTKTGKCIPNGHEIYQMDMKYTKWT
jgi:hypothetical protein